MSATAKAVSVDIGTPVRPWPGRNDKKIKRGRRDHAADRAGDRQSRGAPAREMADCELALDLEAHDNKEQGQQPIVDPMQERQRKAAAVEGKAEPLLPERGEARPQGGVGQGDGDNRRQQQQDARRGSPAGEIERRRAHPVAECAQHRVGQRAFVPRPVVAAAIDEEGWSDDRPARRGAGLVHIDTRLRADDRRIVRPAAIGGNAEVACDRNDVVLGQGLRARHQLDVRVSGPLDQFGGAAGKFDADERPMTEDIAHPVAELIAHFGDPLVRGAAIGACVAAVFDERDGGVRRAEDVVCLVIHRPIEPIAQRHVRHGKFPIRLRRRQRSA